MRRGRVVIAVLSLAMASTTTASGGTASAPDVPVARVGSQTIFLRDVAPNSRMTDDAARKVYTQRRLAARIESALVDFAFAKYSCSISETDVRHAMPRIMSDPDVVRATAAANRRIASAVRRVHHGEDADRVYREELSAGALQAAGIHPIAISRTAFDGFIRDLDDDGVVEAFLAKGTEDAIRARYRQWAEAAAKRSCLRGVIRGLGESEPAFWKRMLRESNAEILVPGFHLPDLDERSPE